MAHARHLKATSSGVAMRSRNNSWIQEVLTCGGKVEGTWLPNYFKGNERERDIKKIPRSWGNLKDGIASPFGIKKKKAH